VLLYNTLLPSIKFSLFSGICHSVVNDNTVGPANNKPGLAWRSTLTKWLITETLEAITIVSRLERLEMWTTQLQRGFSDKFNLFEAKRGTPLSYAEARSILLCVLAGMY
jgi:hypothetical protein